MHLSQNNADMRIHGLCEPSQFEAVLQRIVKRHAMLRTTLAAEPDSQGHFQLLEHDDENCYSLTVLDLSDMAYEAQQRRIRQLIRELSQPFDLTRGPLHRALLIRENRKSCRWIWTFSHFISDGECGKLMASEFYKLFDAIAEGGDAVLPPVASSHRDYVAELCRQRAASGQAGHRERLRLWMAAVRRTKQGMAAFHCPRSPIRFRTYEVAVAQPPASAANTTANPMDTAYTALVQAASDWLDDLPEVPVASLHHGRRYGKRMFFNLAGDFHDRIPLLIPVDRQDARRTQASLVAIKAEAETDPPNYFSIAQELVERDPGLLDDIVDIPVYFNFTELVSYLDWRDGDRYQQLVKEHTLVPEGIYDGQCGLLMHRVAKDRLLFSLTGHQLEAAPFAELTAHFERRWQELSGTELHGRDADGLVL